ncbi:zinc ribbon domain-containing protein [Methanobrevibacter sp.]|uniref:zinc ribbon domain-containing protein n=1 Tax=Methanobrevibacter sp. TaxID=66852 RepID=UPI00260924C0|nr:zinc ribbon domain-containing protein [uncultured Methanobrevibacter sp.]
MGNGDFSYCKYCGESIVSDDAIFCGKCGERLVEKEVEEYVPLDDEGIIYHKNKYLALFLSLFPGFGQFHNGQILKGFLFIIISLILANLKYTHLIGGNILDTISLIYSGFYFYNLYDAYKNASNINKNNGNYFYNENLRNGISESKNGILRNFHKLDLKISSYFHNIDYNGKKSVSVWKIILIFIAYLIIDEVISEILHIPEVTWENFWE